MGYTARLASLPTPTVPWFPMTQPTLPPLMLIWPPHIQDSDIMDMDIMDLDITSWVSVLLRPRLRLILVWLLTPTVLLFLTMLLFMEVWDMDIMVVSMVIPTGVSLDDCQSEYCTNFTLDVSRTLGASELFTVSL